MSSLRKKILEKANEAPRTETVEFEGETFTVQGRKEAGLLFSMSNPDKADLESKAAQYERVLKNKHKINWQCPRDMVMDIEIIARAVVPEDGEEPLHPIEVALMAATNSDLFFLIQKATLRVIGLIEAEDLVAGNSQASTA